MQQVQISLVPFGIFQVATFVVKDFKGKQQQWSNLNRF